jgi:hypothetical protein
MEDVSIAVAADLSEADPQTVVDGLVSYNAEQGYVWERKPLHVLAARPTAASSAGFSAR